MSPPYGDEAKAEWAALWPKAKGGVALVYWRSQDGEQQLMVATELTWNWNASDQGAMMGRFDEVKETFDAQPETVLADAGYRNERDLSELEARGIDGYVAPGREGKRVVASNGP